MRPLLTVLTLAACMACEGTRDPVLQSLPASAVAPTASAASPNPSTAPPHTASAAPLVTSPPQPAALDPLTAPDFGPPGPVIVEPKVPAFERAMMDHSNAFGWTADSGQFGYCMTSGGSGSTRCSYLLANGKVETETDQAADDQPDPKKTPALKARIARHSQRDPQWAYARDLVIAWQAIHLGDMAGTSSARPELHVGARVRDSKSPALPLKVRADANYYTIHPESIAVSPNGKRLALLSHAYAGEFSDDFALKSIAIDELASQAYNNAGLELHRLGKFDEAASLFHRAAYADVKSKLPSYNLACALARSNSSNASKALELAIARGGAEVKAKAAKDADFDAVRAEPWFVALTQK